MTTRRVTANLPADLLQKATELTGAGITETLVEGLESILKKETLTKAKKLQGKIRIFADGGRKDGATGK
jgi:hypothetical protein